MMRFEYSRNLRHSAHLFSLAQNCELEIREVFNDLVSVEISYDLAENQRVCASLSDVGKTAKLIFTAAELENERQTAVKLKQVWSDMFQPAGRNAADSYDI
jgi:hypothetical protein